MITRPMLAGKAPALEDLKYPVIVTPKIDGIRCLIINGEAVSRSFKPIPNRYIRKRLMELPSGVDGELTVGANFNESTSGIMSEYGEPNFTYRVFDWVRAHPDEGYVIRIARLGEVAWGRTYVTEVTAEIIDDANELLEYEAKCLAAGYEGVMIRDPHGPYKMGRSTTKEGYLLKLKRFEDDEAVVIQFKELLHNDNAQTKDAFGLAERSSHKANLVPMNTLGALMVENSAGVIFEIGTGFDKATRDKLWSERGSLVGRVVKYRHQPHGAKDAPRFPVFLGFRSQEDL